VARFPTERLGDSELVEAAARGDATAVGIVWKRYSGHVRGVLFGALGPDHSIDDLVQDVFVGFLKGARNVSDGAALRGYLTGVAVRLAALELRRRKVRRWVMLSPTGELPEQCAFPTDAESRQALRALYRVLDGLGSRRRLAFVLRHVQGLEMVEAANALGVSESTLRRELARARAHLAKSGRREPALQHYLARFERGQT
jgi:RNA polymerase sigma-70 factor (ECF subfamily)